MPNRILIVGCPGSGKSTLARELGAKTGLPVVHLDKLYWRDNWTSISNAEFDALLRAELDKDSWIIDGNYSRTMPMRLERAEVVIWLDFPTPVCLFGAMKRVFSNYGKVRPDMGPNCPERIDVSFLKYIIGFKKTAGAKLERLLSDRSDCLVYRLSSRKEAYALLKSL